MLLQANVRGLAGDAAICDGAGGRTSRLPTLPCVPLWSSPSRYPDGLGISLRVGIGHGHCINNT